MAKISVSPNEFVIKGKVIPTLPQIDCASVLVTSLSMKLSMIEKVPQYKKAGISYTVYEIGKL